MKIKRVSPRVYRVLHVFLSLHVLFMCFFVANVTLHAIAQRAKETKESIAHTRVKSFSLVEFSRLDGKIKLPKS